MKILQAPCSRRQLVGAAASVAGLFASADPRVAAQGVSCAHLQSFAVPSGSHPHDVAPAADGAGIWFTAQATGQLGLFHPLTGDSEMIDLGDKSAPHGVIVAADGAAWITDGGRNEIIRVDASSKRISRFPTGITDSLLNTAAFDGDGIFWFTSQQGFVGRVDPERKKVVVAEAPRGWGPYGMCVTPGGEIWFVSILPSFLGRTWFRNGEIEFEEYDPPTPDAGTRRVWSDSAGRLWVSQWRAGKLARYDPESKQWREWKLPGDVPQAYAVYVDEWDIVWVTDFGANAIVRFDPETEEFHSLPLPHAEGSVRQLLGRSGEIWGAESAADHLVVIRTVCAGP